MATVENTTEIKSAADTGVRVTNWEGTIESHPRVIVYPRTVEELVEIVTDRDKYPSPVRPVGSNHSTTACATADGGTLVVMGHMSNVIEIGGDFVSAQAGAIYIDVARELQRRGLQFYVNCEIGNLSIGSACCCGTKESAFPGEYSQVSSYVSSMKLVTPSGELLEVTESDPELMALMRSGHGLLGIVYEATFRVRPLQCLDVHHERVPIEQFGDRLPELVAGDRSVMMYIFPFLGNVLCEVRRYAGPADYIHPARWVWLLRNYAWATAVPWIAHYVWELVPNKRLRWAILDLVNRTSARVLGGLHSSNSLATDQIIRYPNLGGTSKYSFSLWAFPAERYGEVLRAYVDFCKDYLREREFRSNMITVGYRVSRDRSSLLSYTWDGDMMTIDPVSTAPEGWEEFLLAYNEFCSAQGGMPLFNQTKWLTPEQAERAYGERLETFREQRRRYDPDDRMLNPFFAAYMK